jgi:hypothetical protein
VRQTVNSTMVQTYWQIDRLIVEGEQRAAYAKQALPELAKRLTFENWKNSFKCRSKTAQKLSFLGM